MPVVGIKCRDNTTIENIGFVDNIDTAIQARGSTIRVNNCRDIVSSIFFENLATYSIDWALIEANNSIGTIEINDSGEYNGIVNNKVKGIYLEAVVDSVVAANRVIAGAAHGIDLLDCDDNIVHDNQIRESALTSDNTYDGIHLQGDSNRNSLQGNVIRSQATPNQYRYAINIAEATCDCNIVVTNSLGLATDYGTSGLNDAGTLTQLSYPADINYGDNFIDCGAGS